MAKEPTQQLVGPQSGMYGDVAGSEQSRPMLPAGDTAMRMQTRIVTAQKVALPRSEVGVRQQMISDAAAAGDKYFYSIPFKGKSGGTMVEGPSVKLTSDAARRWGNCEVDCEFVGETHTHFIFEGIFTDFETGYVLRRPYRQRKAQDVGIADSERALDQIFQIGASKATRNVVHRALPELVDSAFEAARAGLVKKIGAKPDEWRKKMRGFIDQQGVPINRIERLYGKALDKFTNQDLAKLASQCSAVQDNMIDADLCWPPGEESAAEAAKTVEDKTAEKKPAGKKPGPKTKKKTKESAKETETEPSSEQAEDEGAATTSEEETTSTEDESPSRDAEDEAEQAEDEDDTDLKFD